MWTDKRFSTPVIQSYGDALDTLKARHHAKSLELIGYSGGGYVAMVLAGTRSDVVRVQTLAGNLDPKSWVRHHQLSPMADLRDTGEFDRLKDLPQEHFVGSDDKVVPGSLVQAYVRQNRFTCARVTSVAATHEAGWDGIGSALSKKPTCDLGVLR
jgi:alpha/beta superfamily hydrolase